MWIIKLLINGDAAEIEASEEWMSEQGERWQWSDNLEVALLKGFPPKTEIDVISLKFMK